MLELSFLHCAFPKIQLVRIEQIVFTNIISSVSDPIWSVSSSSKVFSVATLTRQLFFILFFLHDLINNPMNSTFLRIGSRFVTSSTSR